MNQTGIVIQGKESFTFMNQTEVVIQGKESFTFMNQTGVVVQDKELFIFPNWIGMTTPWYIRTTLPYFYFNLNAACPTVNRLTVTGTPIHRHEVCFELTE